ncbi:MAG: cell division protein FtsZ [archaeon]
MSFASFLERVSDEVEAPPHLSPQQPVSEPSHETAERRPESTQPKPHVEFKSEDNFDGFETPDARIVIVGVGGAGNNTVTRLVNMGGAHGAETAILNTDKQHLKVSKADKKLLIGYELTKGLGAGGFPKIGREAALESKDEIRDLVRNANLCFLSTGLGGGTGTGAVSVVAELAKKEGAIVIAVCTMPFNMEKARIEKAEEGLIQLRELADTVIVIDNNKLVEYVPDLPLNKAFAVADELIATMIRGISETITKPSLVNLDFADIKATMSNGGVAMIGVGESNTKNRAEEAVQDALRHPLLDVDFKGATGALIHITGGEDLSLSEATKVGEMVSNHLDPHAQVIWGARIDPGYTGKLQVMCILTGVKSPQILGRLPMGTARSVAMRSEELPLTPYVPRKPPLLREMNIDYIY